MAQANIQFGAFSANQLKALGFTQMSRRQDDKTWAIYCRSFLVTVGIAIGTITTLYGAGSQTSFEPALGYAVLYALAALLVLVGLLASTRFMLAFAEVVGHDAISVVFLILAFPVYLVIRPFYVSRR